MTTEDLIFLIRHDKAKVNRLRTYLSWKDVRKNARDTQDGAAAEGADLLDDAGLASGGPGGASGNDASKALKVQKSAKIRLPWEIQFMFSEQPLEANEDEEDEEEIEAVYASIQRLKTADERTRDMTREEYVHWSECRQASFTFRKAKRFREWAGISQLIETKPHDDIVDTLGFLTFELVCSLTEEALKVKELEEMMGDSGTKHVAKKRKRDNGLFDGPDDDQRPIMPRHIEEAYRRLQVVSPMRKTIRNYTGGLIKSNMQLI